MWGHFKFAYEAPIQTTSNWITEPDNVESNHGLHCRIIMWDLCSFQILCSIEWSFFTDISEKTVDSIFKGPEIQKREDSMIEVN